MKKQLTAVIAAMLVVGTVSLHAQTSTAAPATTTAKKAKPAKAKAETAEQRAIRELQEKMAAQQAEIDALKQQNAAKDAALSAAQSTAASAQSQAATAQSQAAAAQSQAQSATAAAQSQADAVTSLKSTVTDLQGANASLAATINTTKTDLNDEINSPAALHYKGVTITPGGFAAFEGVWRERSVNSDINTPLNSIPFPSANEGHVSELNFSGRQSRLSALVQGNARQLHPGRVLRDGLAGNGHHVQQQSVQQLRAASAPDLGPGCFQVRLHRHRRPDVVAGNGRCARERMRARRSSRRPSTRNTWLAIAGPVSRKCAFSSAVATTRRARLPLAVSVEQAQITSFTANGTNPAEYFFAGTGQNGGLYNAAVRGWQPAMLRRPPLLPPTRTTWRRTSS